MFCVLAGSKHYTTNHSVVIIRVCAWLVTYCNQRKGMLLLYERFSENVKAEIDLKIKSDLKRPRINANSFIKVPLLLTKIISLPQFYVPKIQCSQTESVFVALFRNLACLWQNIHRVSFNF